jgi:hypothetical protein
MDRRLFLVVSLVLNSHWGWSFEYFGGLTELINYKSSLPCVADENGNCFAANGIMGMTLDKASQAGLHISSIVLQNENEIYVTSKTYGVCLVDSKNSNYKDKVLFLCSSVKNGSLTSKPINKILSLQKDKNNQFKLDEVKNPKGIQVKL